MPNFNIDNFPLLDFFEEFRRYDNYTLVRKGITFNQYLILLEALGQGIGLMHEEQLFTICKLILLKPYHSEEVFKDLFEQYLNRFKDDTGQQDSAVVDTSDTKSSEEKDHTEDQQEQSKTTEENNKENKSNQGDKEDPVTREPEQENNDPDNSHHESGEEGNEGTKSPDRDKAFSSHIPIYYERASGEKNISLETDTIYTQGVEDQQKEYIVQGRFLPFKERDLQQQYRLVYDKLKSGPTEILWEDTIQKVAKEGFFSEWVMGTSTQRKSSLYLLIDYSESMIAFYDLCESMAYNLKDRSNKRKQVFYFFNYISTPNYVDEWEEPEQQASPNTAVASSGILFGNPERTEAISLVEFNQGARKSIIILSDAGAARGHYRIERVNRTMAFLARMSHHKVIWLNPMPRTRWKDTSAEYISSTVDMYEVSDRELSLAMKRLKMKS